MPLNPEQWERVSELFEIAVALPTEQRAAFLRKTREDFPTLHAELAQLLADHEKTGGFLSDPGWEALPSAIGFGPLVNAGSMVGPYRVIDEIGRGGMAVVYLAERADGQFDQQVALKLMRPGDAREEFIRRFEQERQILALLNHPNIARLLDGGLAEDGRPYFAMEYVAGMPIDQYCDNRRLSIDDRIQLIMTVGHAVQHAHALLIVHRDLKPSNILVSTDGQIKLLDFGIAKLTEPQHAAYAVPATRTQQRLMTPEYASPEQVTGAPVTVATDVYQLGALAYELLTGQRTLRLQNRTAGEVERAICHQQPSRPSDAVTRPGEPLDTDALSKARRTTPTALRGKLRGDLDNIVLKALAKEPRQRYQSVDHLVEDLERFRRNEPVRARKPTWAYRSGRFVSRHRFGVIAASLVFASLVAGLVGTAWQAQVARAQATKSAKAIEFLVAVFETADPEEERDRDITAREVLDRGAERMAIELREQPDVHAEMMNAIGRIYRNIGLQDRAEVMLTDALTMRRQLHGPNSLEVSDTLTELAALYANEKDYAASHAHHAEALTIRQARQGPRSLGIALNMHEMGMALYGQGQFEDAERVVREALAIRHALTPTADRALGEALSDLAIVLHARGELQSAERLQREALDINTRALGVDHPVVARTSLNLAAVLRALGDPDGAAEGLLRESLRIRRLTFGNRHENVANGATGLALVLSDMGEFEEAQRLLLEALAIRRQNFGNDNPALAMSLVNCGYVFYLKGDMNNAEVYYREAVALARAGSIQDHPRRGVSSFWYARLLADSGRHTEATPLFKEALRVYEITYGRADEWSLNARLGLAECLAALAEFEQAREVLQVGYEATSDGGADRQRVNEAFVQLFQAWDRPDVAARYRVQSESGQ